jgi:putative hydrolase of the HAD superfamily
MKYNAKHVIFDLGGVILNLDYSKTRTAFEALGLKNFDAIYSQANQSGLFDDFETGACSTPYFINHLLDFLPAGTTPNQVVAAWNAMILDFPIPQLELLERLKNTHRIFLLSNTNEIQLAAVQRALHRAVGHSDLDRYFEKAFYSHTLEKRKPHPETFQWVCDTVQIEPADTLFIDDTLQHIEGAKKIGLQTHHLQPTETILQLFS